VNFFVWVLTIVVTGTLVVGELNPPISTVPVEGQRKKRGKIQKTLHDGYLRQDDVTLVCKSNFD
jgi:hypothetical protein